MNSVLKVLILLVWSNHDVLGFSSSSSRLTRLGSNIRRHGIALDATVEDSTTTTEKSVQKLKNVLYREYVSFFDPMQREYYAEGVSFEDPMTSLSGVDAYQFNVDMLSGRTIPFFFKDGGIVLHSITGGEVSDDGMISDIITRWSLSVTVQILPWKPTARFTGISVYQVSQGGSEGVLINKQIDYWDSINIKEGGKYDKVDKGIAIKDFLNQLKPDNGNAAAAGPEVPYSLLRRGKDYEIRKYPSYTLAKIPYTRRDEGYDLLATLTKGMDPLAPAIMEVFNDDSEKTMAWPLVFAAPGETKPKEVKKEVLDRSKDSMWRDCEILTLPEKIVAVGSFSDASVAPIVRKADRNLRESLTRDGIEISQDSNASVKFAQYDAIFSLGKRRGEVWLELNDKGGHPW